MMGTRAAAATSGKPARQDASAHATTCKQTAKAAWNTIQAAFAVVDSIKPLFLIAHLSFHLAQQIHI